MHVRTLEEVMQPFLHYPKTIQLAILRAETHPAFSALTRSGKAVLKQLLTRANKEDGERPIRARLDVVADQAGVSYKTVQRTLSKLKEIGWLEVLTTGRSEWGLFTSHHYQFSQQLCKLVELPVKGCSTSDRTQMSDGPIYDLTFKKDQLEISLKNKSEKPISLPDDLLEICSLGVKASGVCKLRGLAFKAGHSLSDIWLVAKKRLHEINAKGSRAYQYLSKMILTPSDYKGRASQTVRLTEAGNTTSVEWWRSASGITQKGRELGVEQTEAVFAHFRDRVLALAGDGPWMTKVRTSPVQISGFQRTSLESGTERVDRAGAMAAIREMLGSREK